ncbi:YceI family protein [Cellulomonas denverensis]|uniref:YceI family protein n=1 Tax=Cellulomonas denverensis TaxID=264297 RepID=A0A7X6KSV4_9CELL|nr:YceI family protein [Cellulomonas denverensis]NKY21632.1 YceI family protein [Cellulomonas denverensis]GIG25523.1 hypothetical protein Cde04nite_17670 [Cellulomonas denverensis]
MTALPTGLVAGTWNIDPSHTEASFTVRHAGISKVRGTVAVTGGTLTVNDELELSAVTATLDPSTITTGDAGRDGHLKSGDFFDVEKFGEWTFTSTGVKAEGDDYIVSGDLTIHGVTRNVNLAVEFGGAATDPFGNQRAGFSATLPISRKDFDLTWNAALETGGVLVSDKVNIALEVSAIKA